MGSADWGVFADRMFGDRAVGWAPCGGVAVTNVCVWILYGLRMAGLAAGEHGQADKRAFHLSHCWRAGIGAEGQISLDQQAERLLKAVKAPCARLAEHAVAAGAEDRGAEFCDA